MRQFKYRKPPIQEAVCEIHMVVSPLTKETMGKIGEMLKGEFPTQNMVEEKTVNVELALDKAKTSEVVTGTKLIARSQDQRNLVQITPRTFIVNRLAPYDGWEEAFRGRIVEKFRQSLSITRASEISRIGLRYINRIELPSASFNWSDWFSVVPPTPGPLEGKQQLFHSHSTFVLGDGVRVVVNLGTFPGSALPSEQVLLDIDVIWEGKAGVDCIETMLDKVHTPHNILFESYLRDSLRKLFIPT